jgi:hypothetical protein
VAAGSPSASSGAQPSTGAAAGGVAQSASVSVGTAIGGGQSVTQTITWAGPSFTQLLLRNATDGARVRLYKQDITAPKVTCPAGASCPQPAMPPCGPTTLATVEVSDDQVAGQTGGPLWPSTSAAAPLDVVAVGVVGAGQPQPILVVAAKTDASVAKVTLTTPYGSDSQAPIGDWVALAVQLPQTFTKSGADGLGSSTLVATDSSGKTLVSQGLSQAPKLPPGCGPCPALGAPVPAPAPNTKGAVAPLPAQYVCQNPCSAEGSTTKGAVPNIAMCVRPPGTGTIGSGTSGAGTTTGNGAPGAAGGGSSSASSGPATVTSP